MAYRLEETAADAKTESKLVNRDNFGKSIEIEKPADHLEIRLPLEAAEGRDSFRLILDYYYCRTGAEGLCKTGTVFWNIPLEASAAAESSAFPLKHRVP